MADSPLTVEIITPQKVVYSGKAVSVSMPGSLAPFQVLSRHAPIVSSLEVGLIRIVGQNNNYTWFAVGSGFTEVLANRVSILVEHAVEASSINTDSTRANLAQDKEKLKATEDPVKKAEIKELILFGETCLKAAEKNQIN